jgi:hypothetical protein
MLISHTSLQQYGSGIIATFDTRRPTSRSLQGNFALHSLPIHNVSMNGKAVGGVSSFFNVEIEALLAI